MENNNVQGLDETALQNFLDTDLMPEGISDNLPDLSENNESEETKPEVLPKEVKPIIKAETKESIQESLEQNLGDAGSKEGEETDSIAYQIFQGMQSALGIEFSEEELSSIELTDDLDTVNKLILLGTEKKTEVAFNQFFENNPDIHEAVVYKQANGSLEGFGDKQIAFTDYEKVDLSTEANQEQIYRQALALKGLNAEDINELVEVAKDKYNLESKARLGREELVASEQSKKAEYEKSIQAKIQQKEESDRALVQEVTRLIDSGKIMGVTLDAKTQRQFRDYFSKPVDAQGRTAKEIADENTSVEQDLLFEYWKMTGFKGMANSEAKKIRNLADLVKKGQNERPNIILGSKSLDRQQTAHQDFDADAVKNFIES